MVIARAAAFALAVLACAWFALGIHQVRDTSRASSIVAADKPLDAAQLTHLDSLLSSAATLNPDRQVEMLRGQAALLAGRGSRAARIFHQIAREEPMNLQAWVYLAEATRSVRVRSEAITQIARLEPPVKRRR